MNRPLGIACMRGFTLIELMITIAIAAILMGIAVPAFTAVMERNRLSNYSNELLGTLTYARNEARNRRVEIQLCSSANGSDCDADWNSDHPLILRQSDGTLVRKLPTPPGDSSLSVSAIEFSWNSTTQRLNEVLRPGEGNTIRYTADGEIKANAQGRRARRLCINLGGSSTPFSLFQSGQIQIQPEAPCN